MGGGGGGGTDKNVSLAGKDEMYVSDSQGKNTDTRSQYLILTAS